MLDGWMEYPDQFRKGARCFFKRFDTEVCQHNDDQPGNQVCLSMWNLSDGTRYTIDLYGVLIDGTSIKIENYGFSPQCIRAALDAIPRLLRTWECAATHLTPHP